MKIKLNNYTISPDAYTYSKMMKDLSILKNKYPFLESYFIGRTVLNKNIPAVVIGKGQKVLFCHGSHHSREWITSALLMKFIELFCSSYALGNKMCGYDLQKIYRSISIWIVPMVNPDGVDLCINGPHISSLQNQKVIELNNNSSDFTSWKANINGVDLNRNYDAGWEKYKKLEAFMNISGPSPSGYAGANKESEPETQAIIKLTRKISPYIMLAFHAQGEEIYYTYEEKSPKSSRKMANEFSEASGYKVIKYVEKASGYGGCKDWFINEFNKPGFTIETGRDTTPVPIEQFDEIVNKNIPIILKACEFC